MLQQNFIGAHFEIFLLITVIVAVAMFFLIWRKRGGIKRDKECVDWLKQLVPIFRKAPLSQMEAVYIQFVLQRFKPVSYQKISYELDKVEIFSKELWVPALNGQSYFVLGPSASGNAYTKFEVDWVEMVLYVARQTESSKQQRKIGVKEERQRIRRDLHDELTQDLIALMRHANDEVVSHLAVSAMSSLKSILSALSEEESDLQNFLVVAQAQMRERLLMHDVGLEWFEKNISPGVIVSSQEVSNVLKILKESSCNVIKHSEADVVKVVVNQFGKKLEVRIENPIGSSKLVSDSNKLGVKNMLVRAQELNGQLEILESKGVFTVVLSFPLEGMQVVENV